MADRITVMSWLEGLADSDWQMYHSDSEVQNIAKEALALLKEDCHNCKLECLLQKYDELKEKYDSLLKEQEAIEPTIDEHGNKRCGSCGHKLQSIADPDLFCCKCGKPVLWEGR